MESSILDDVNLFVVKGIKYRAMSSGIISGKPMHIIESVGPSAFVFGKIDLVHQVILKIDRGDGFSVLCAAEN